MNQTLPWHEWLLIGILGSIGIYSGIKWLMDQIARGS